MSSDIGAISRQPDNFNFLSDLGFRFSVRKLPNVSWFIQTIALPGVSLGQALQPTPFIDAVQPGEKLTYEDLQITFKVDENLNTWVELQEWMTGIGSPVSFKQYERNEASGSDAIISDATLVILNSHMNPIFEVIFHDIFPINVGELQFNTTDTDVEYFTLNATFHYLNYEYRRISR